MTRGGPEFSDQVDGFAFAALREHRPEKVDEGLHAKPQRRKGQFDSTRTCRIKTGGVFLTEFDLH